MFASFLLIEYVGKPPCELKIIKKKAYVFKLIVKSIKINDQNIDNKIPTRFYMH